MDMWVSHAMRRRDCVLCTVRIQPGDEVMVSQWKRTYSYGTRTRRQMSHFGCWYVHAQIWLDEHPYVPVIKAGPGRPQKYTGEQIAKRRNLQNNIKRWGLKQKEYVGTGMWAMAGKYGDKVAGARGELNGMRCDK